MSRKLQIKRGLQSKLPTLADGEFGLTTDQKKLYIGCNGNVRLATETDISQINTLLNTEITNRQNADAQKLPLTGGTLSGYLKQVRDTPQIQLLNTHGGQEGFAMLYEAEKMIKISQNDGAGYDANNRTIFLLTHSAPSDLNNAVRIQRNINGNDIVYNIYGTHNITVSNAAPTTTLPNGCMHNVY